MKKFTLSVFFAFTMLLSYAQPNFTSADMPNIGDNDTVMYLVYYPIENDLNTETGNGYTWDFSSLPFSMYPNFKQIITYRVKTHYVSEPFVNATIEEYIYDGTAGDVNLYSYSNDTLYIHRLGPVVTGTPFIPALPHIAFPLSMNNSSELTYIYYSNITPLGERKSTVVYDGFGNLQMPDNKSYTNVFRVKLVERDTSFIYHNSITYTSYIWYKQGGQIPLLRLSYTGSLNLYFVFGSKANGTSSGIEDVYSQSNFDIFPNPSSGKFEISTRGFIPEQLEIYNLQGEKILQRKLTGEIDLSDVAKGVYIVKLTAGTNCFSKKIILN
jgi:hypothetical protein